MRRVDHYQRILKALSKAFTASPPAFTPLETLLSSNPAQITSKFSTSLVNGAENSIPLFARRFSSQFSARTFSSSPPLVSKRVRSSNTTSGKSSNSSSWARYFLLAPPLIAAGLCKWQLDRRQWKMDLLERRQRIMKGEALDIFSDDMPEPEEYQRVKATGTFDYSRTQYIGPRPRSRMGTTEVGYLAVTPLVQQKQAETGSTFFKKKETPSSGRQIMVLRGWVPANWRNDPAARKHDEPSSTITVEGIIRYGEDPGTFVPENKPDQGTWFYINAEELAAAAGLPSGTPLVEIVSPDEEMRMLDGGPTVMEVLGGRGKYAPAAPAEVYPLAKSEGDLGAFSVMPRDHLNYALTWATLMTATGIMGVKAIRKGR